MECPKVIIVERRAPRNKYEKGVYAWTAIAPGRVLASIFLNEQKNRRPYELVNSLFHELAHAIVGLYEIKITKKQDEKLADLIGSLVEDAFKKG